MFDTRSGRILSEYSYNKRDNIDDGINGGTGPRHSTGDKESVVRTSTNTPIHNESKNPDDEEIKDHEPLKARYSKLWLAFKLSYFIINHTQNIYILNIKYIVMMIQIILKMN